MARDLATGMTAEVQKSRLYPVMLVKLAFDSGDLNLWDGLGDLVFDGDTYTGAGDLIGVGEIRETATTEAASTTLTLSGVPASLIATALTESYQGRTAKIWLAAVEDGAGSLLADASKPLFVGLMDVMEMAEDGETATFSLTIENRLAALERPNKLLYTPEYQKALVAGDKGFDSVAALQEAEIVWGRG